MQISKRELAYTSSRYFLIFIFISHLGWIWETLYTVALDGIIYDRGFLALPICPIYGSALLAQYFILGTVNEPRGLLKFAQNQHARIPIYFCMSVLIPTVFELFTGLFFTDIFNLRLWDYSDMNFNTGGYIALYISVMWGIMIFIFMNIAFPLIKRKVFDLPRKACVMIAIPTAIATAIDFVIQSAKLFIR